ncbi:MAG TPA: FAD-dependent oxidoreductase [Chloroflexota bacterium]|nr:FAD-dependent oxidoreductase [Chloroflexota bacterium]
MNAANVPLALVAEEAASVRRLLREGKVTLGSDPASSLPLRDPDVSPRHAQLVVSHGHVTVSDLHSATGTYVNERRLGGPAPLRPGDLLRVGSRRFRLEGPRRHEVLILGGGFGGVYTALELEKRLRRRRDVGVTLISRDNYFLFQPMLAELVSGSIETQHILTPLRRLLPRTQVFSGEVQAIDFPARQVHVSTGLEDRLYPVAFDSLVLALGSVTDLSRFPGLTEHAILAKTVGDGFGLRNHALDMLEKADAEGDPDERGRLLTFAVAGGGFSGVEVMAELADLLHDALPLYPGIDRRELRLVLIQSGPRILPEVNERLAAFAKRQLERKGIEVKTNSGISALTPTEAVLRDGSLLPTRTLVATIGNRPHPLVETVPCGRNERGAVVVNEYLQTSEPGVYALGDLAAVPDARTGGTCPPTAQYAIREARFLAHNLLATLDSGRKLPFAFGGLGQLASLGHGSAVAEVFGRRLSGWPAWWLWRGVYLSKLPSRERKVRVLADWLLGSALPRDTARLKLERTTSIVRMHYQPGQAIVEQGDVGSRFFLIIEGKVEVVRIEPGGAETRLNELSAGDYFGEMALLRGLRRNATVRAITPVDLLSMERGDFMALATHGPFFRERLDAIVAERLAASAPAESS